MRQKTKRSTRLLLVLALCLSSGAWAAPAQREHGAYTLGVTDLLRVETESFRANEYDYASDAYLDTQREDIQVNIVPVGASIQLTAKGAVAQNVDVLTLQRGVYQSVNSYLMTADGHWGDYRKGGMTVPAGQKASLEVGDLVGDSLLCVEVLYQVDGKSYNDRTYFRPVKEQVGRAAYPTANRIQLAGQAMAFEAYNIDGSNYFKLRDLASALSGTEAGFSVDYNDATGAVSLAAGREYEPVGGELAPPSALGRTTAKPSAISLTLDGHKVRVQAYTIDGSNYFRLRDLASLLDFYVGYDNAASLVTIDAEKPYQW